MPFMIFGLRSSQPAALSLKLPIMFATSASVIAFIVKVASLTLVIYSDGFLLLEGIFLASSGPILIQK